MESSSESTVKMEIQNTTSSAPPLFIEGAHSAAQTILTFWIRQVLHETSSSLLRTRIMQRNAQTLQLKRQKSQLNRRGSFSKTEKMKDGISMDIPLELLIKTEDITDAYKSTQKMARKWVKHLERMGEIDIASIVRKLCHKGCFLELEDPLGLEPDDTNQMPSSEVQYTGTSNSTIKESASKIPNNNATKNTKETTFINCEKEIESHTNIGKMKESKNVILSKVGDQAFFNVSKEQRKTSPSLQFISSSKSSEWKPLPSRTSVEQHCEKKSIHIPIATVQPPSQIEQLHSERIYGTPVPTMTLVPLLADSATTDTDSISKQEQNNYAISLEERREMWLKTQISKIDQIATQLAIPPNNNQFHLNDNGFNWYYGWEGIQKAVEELPKRLKSQLSQIEYPTKENRSKMYEVVPRCIVEGGHRENKDDICKESEKIDDEPTTLSKESMISTTQDVKKRKEFEVLIANCRSLNGVLVDRHRHKEAKKRRIQRELEKSHAEELFHNKRQLQMENDATKGREPSPVGDETYVFDEIKSEIMEGNGRMSAHKLEKDMIHPTRDEGPSSDEENLSIVQGALKIIGAIHTCEQYPMDSKDEVQVLDAKKIVQRRRHYQKERLGFNFGRTTFLPESSLNTKSKQKTKVSRSIGEDGKEYMDLDLGECMVEWINNGEKKLLAFRSIEICLLEHEP